MAENQDLPHILIVDDDPEMLDLLSRSMKNVATVSTCMHSEDVEACIAEYKPDMLLLDYLMPGRDGLEVCRALRENPDHDMMPIVFLSAHGETEIRTEGYAVGAEDFLCKPFDLKELRSKVHIWTQLAHRSAELLRRNRDLLQKATHDSLTGILHRKYALRLLEREVARYNRHGAPLAVLMIDIDDFKHINDQYGHTAGDEALLAVTSYLQKNLRAADILARYGGDEFLIILPDTDANGTERLCQKLQQTEIPWGQVEDENQKVSLSIGAVNIGRKRTSPQQLVDAADLAMLVAKKKGKGRYYLERSDTAIINGEKMRETLHLARTTTRERLCKVIETLLIQTERDGDIIQGRREMMLALGDKLSDQLSLPPEDRMVLRNVIRLNGYERMRLPVEIDVIRGGLDEQHKMVVREILLKNVSQLFETGFLEEEARILEHVHEWWNGNGFPHGMCGEEIPRHARILSLLNAYTRLREGGLHTSIHDRNTAREAILEQSGTHFDPSLVKPFLHVVEEYYKDSHDQRSGSILLIDDHKHIGHILCKHLTAVGYEVIVAESAREMRQIIYDRTWQAILLDVILPDGDGLTICEELRSLPNLATVPIAILTCRSDQECLDRARDARANACFLKPVSMEVLLRYLAHVTHQEDTPIPQEMFSFQVFC